MAFGVESDESTMLRPIIPEGTVLVSAELVYLMLLIKPPSAVLKRAITGEM